MSPFFGSGGPKTAVVNGYSPLIESGWSIRNPEETWLAVASSEKDEFACAPKTET